MTTHHPMRPWMPGRRRRVLLALVLVVAIVAMHCVAPAAAQSERVRQLVYVTLSGVCG